MIKAWLKRIKKLIFRDYSEKRDYSFIIKAIRDYFKEDENAKGGFLIIYGSNAQLDKILTSRKHKRTLKHLEEKFGSLEANYESIKYLLKYTKGKDGAIGISYKFDPNSLSFYKYVSHVFAVVEGVTTRRLPKKIRELYLLNSIDEEGKIDLEYLKFNLRHLAALYASTFPNVYAIAVSEERPGEVSIFEKGQLKETLLIATKQLPLSKETNIEETKDIKDEEKVEDAKTTKIGKKYEKKEIVKVSPP